MEEDFTLVKSLLERSGSYVLSIDLDRLDVTTRESRMPVEIFSGLATISIRVASAGIQQVIYQTVDMDEIKYFKSKF